MTEEKIDGWLDVSREVPETKQTWRNQLVLVSSIPTRFVGLIAPGTDTTKKFTLHKAGMYLCNFQFQPTNGGRSVSIATLPHAIIAYDGIEVISELEVVHAQHVIHIAEQGEMMKKFLYENYLAFVSPPKIITPPS